MAESRSAPGFIAYKHKDAWAHDPTEQISIRDGGRAIQDYLHEYEAKVVAAIDSGRSYYVRSKIHYATCPSVVCPFVRH